LGLVASDNSSAHDMTLDMTLAVFMSHCRGLPVYRVLSAAAELAQYPSVEPSLNAETPVA
jgi:hypothetical protein